MKRLVILVLYSIDGEIEEFKKQLITDIQPYAERLQVVCNGKLSKKADVFLKNNCPNVLRRENLGYDAGAYKDVIMRTNLDEYDELVLMNDTFFGFFYSLDDFFCNVRERDEVDFWGLTKHPAGKSSSGLFSQHYQAYFLLVRSRMLHNKEFINFWKFLSYPKTYEEAVNNFEIRFTTFFEERGFKGAAYCNLLTIGIKEEFGENPYYCYPYELVSQLGYPVLKRKSFHILNANIWKAVEYIQKNHLYDVDLMWKQILKDYENHVIKGYFDLNKLEHFIKQYPDIYIYGKGKYGTALYDYFCFHQLTIKKFIVSNKTNEDDSVIELSDLMVDEKTGVVVALKPAYTREVIGGILTKLPEKQIFCGTPVYN